VVRPLRITAATNERDFMKIVIDQDKCRGHARCNALAPDLFELDDLGYVAIAELGVPEGSEQAARDGARGCPERAITIL
jgi:ferredoxin